mgnify:CR=1 FL=1
MRGEKGCGHECRPASFPEEGGLRRGVRTRHGCGAAARRKPYRRFVWKRLVSVNACFGRPQYRYSADQPFSSVFRCSGRERGSRFLYGAPRSSAVNFCESAYIFDALLPGVRALCCAGRPFFAIPQWFVPAVFARILRKAWQTALLITRLYPDPRISEKSSLFKINAAIRFGKPAFFKITNLDPLIPNQLKLVQPDKPGAVVVSPYKRYDFIFYFLFVRGIPI